MDNDMIDVEKLVPSRQVFTISEVAKICKTTPRVASKWFDNGYLKGYRIPGSQDRRVPREYLIRFLKEHPVMKEPLQEGNERDQLAAENAKLRELLGRCKDYLRACSGVNLLADEIDEALNESEGSDGHLHQSADKAK